ncbi:MAG: DUF58 domain-containing protein [Phycisphaeraceae bacterium]|nr:DUF58 domain-containing protein [Phycisphaeraceae bacterium]
MRSLDRLDILSRKILRGKQQGERRSKKKGQSIEFADYRNYVVGDDLRFIDWNLYARLDRLFVRLFMEEEDLSVSIALDCSASMDYGDPNKLLYAKRIAAALGYLALVHYNRVNLYACNVTVVDHLSSLRGRRPIPRMLAFLQQQQPNSDESLPAPGNFEQTCKKLAILQRQPGVVILLSDFFDKGDLSAALRYLAADRYDVYCIQLLSPQETEPASGGIIGDLRLRDMEDGDLAEVSVTAALIKRYQKNLQAYCRHVREQCLRRGIVYLMSETSLPFDSLVLKYLRQRGLLG